MSRKLTAYNRAERWYAQQVKNGKLREADYSALSRKMTLCYEPATMMSQRNEVSKHDILSNAKALKAITDFKL
jgi:hypothetical protein